MIDVLVIGSLAMVGLAVWWLAFGIPSLLPQKTPEIIKKPIPPTRKQYFAEYVQGEREMMASWECAYAPVDCHREIAKSNAILEAKQELDLFAKETKKCWQDYGGAPVCRRMTSKQVDMDFAIRDMPKPSPVYGVLKRVDM